MTCSHKHGAMRFIFAGVSYLSLMKSKRKHSTPLSLFSLSKSDRNSYFAYAGSGFKRGRLWWGWVNADFVHEEIGGVR